MPDRGNSGLLNAVIFILLEVAAYLCLGSTRSLQDIWINRATHRTMAAVWQGGENIRSYFHLKQENQALSEENTRLLESLRHYEEMERAAEDFLESDEETEELSEALSGDLSPRDLKEIKTKHRSDEDREIRNADLQYLKALFHRLQSEKEHAGSSASASMGDSGVSLSLNGTEMPLMSVQTQAQPTDPGAALDIEI